MTTFKIAKALDFARNAHKGQTRKYTDVPYVNHCIDVYQVLVDNVLHVSEDMLIAALLHDTVEDTDVTPWLITAVFGRKIAKLVDELTHKEDKTENRKTRKEKEANRLATISPEAQTIKYADIICNLRDIAEHDPKFAVKYKAEKRDILMKMGDGHVGLRNTAWLAAL